jgi:hypothetical protein
MSANKEESPSPNITEAPPKHADPEYMLKGVQAFAVGVALFGVTFAIASVPFQLVIGHGRPLWIFGLVYLIVFPLDTVISLFACQSMLLAFSMTGLWKPKREISLPDAAAVATSTVVMFSFMNAFLVFADKNGVLAIGGP